tara:strand:+ start:653 stop:1777 length:1125 start_codon:yes stop_codon:yes gene_type:complete
MKLQLVDKTIIHIIGARPNFIKAAPLINEIDKLENIENLILHTGQHYDDNMSKVFFDELNIPKPHYNLNAGGGSHAIQTSNIMVGCEKYFIEKNPDLIIVYGDVNSCVAASLVAVKMGIKIAHIESGLRSFDRTMPEEINRIITDSISDILFLTSIDALDNLKTEGISEDKCHLVGNTMIDSLVNLNHKFDESDILKELGLEKKSYSLITLHRPSNVDNKSDLESMFESIMDVSNVMKCVFPIHPRTKNNLIKFDLYEKYNSIGNLLITDPKGYIDFMCLQKNAKVIITDSGGVQEESSFFGTPCLTVRDNTERPITLNSGTNVLIGSNYKKIYKHMVELNYNQNKSDIEMWDGKSSKRIVNYLIKYLSGENNE